MGVMAEPAMLLAARALLADVGQLVGGVQAGGMDPGGDAVPVDITVARPETLLPLALASVMMMFYLRVIEAAGWAVAAALGVGGGLDSKRRSAKRERFSTAFGEAVYFGVQMVAGYRLFGGTSWYWPSGWDTLSHSDQLGLAIMEGDPSPPVYHWAREMRTFYLIEFGYYSMSVVMVLVKKRRSDFLEMLAHHLISSVLISMSLTYNYVRIGIVIMALHNMFDPFMNMAKCCHYAFKGSLHVLADINFGICLVMFLISRLVLYPIVVYKVCFLSIAYPGKVPVWDATVDQWICKVCLLLLFPLHLFWFYLMMKVAVKALRGGGVQKDERSDSEDEDDKPDNGSGKRKKA